MRKKQFFITVDFSKYKGKYVVIVDKKVVASGTDPKVVWGKAKRKYPRKTPELMKIPIGETLVLDEKHPTFLVNFYLSVN